MNNLKTTEEICQLFKVRRETLFKWRKAGLPYMRIMGVIRYDLDEVTAWVAGQNNESKIHNGSIGGEINE